MRVNDAQIEVMVEGISLNLYSKPRCGDASDSAS